MASIDIKILKYLYKYKTDTKYHDVSLIFSFKEYNYANNYIDFDGNEIKVINSYSDYKSTRTKKLYNRIFNRIKNKEIIDECVIALEENGLVNKLVEGFLPISALTPEDDLSDANNSICRITNKGIEYIEGYSRFNKTRLISIISLIISITAIIISFLSK